MSYQEKQLVVTLSGSIIFLLFYGYYLSQNLPVSLDISYWGYTVVGVLGLKIVVTVVGTLGFNLYSAIITKEKKPLFKDELDSIIELRSLQGAFIVFMLGFLAAMLSVSIGYTIYCMFNIFIVAFVLAEITGVSVQLYLYRKGV